MDKSYKQFLMVAELGNISLAANALGVSQPTLTSAMKKLEANFDAPLFVRKSKGVELTEYGRLLQQKAKEMERQHDTLIHQMADLKARKTQKIKMGTGDAWWEVFVKQALQQYSVQHPSISLHLEFGNHLTLMNSLLHGHIDLFIGHEIEGLSDKCNVSFVPLLQDTEAVYVRSDHPLLLNHETQPDWHLYPLLRVTPDNERDQHLLADMTSKHQERERKQVTERIVYDVSSLLASMDLLRTTQAVMPYPSSMATYFSQYGIKPLPSSGPVQQGTVGLYHMNGIMAEHLCELINQIKGFKLSPQLFEARNTFVSG